MIHTPVVNLTVCCSTFLTLRPPLPSFSFSFFFYSSEWLSTTPRKWEWSCCLQLWVIHTVMHRDSSYTSELLKDSESRREMCSLREEATGLVSKNDQNASCLLTCQPVAPTEGLLGWIRWSGLPDSFILYLAELESMAPKYPQPLWAALLINPCRCPWCWSSRRICGSLVGLVLGRFSHRASTDINNLVPPH